MKQRKHRHKESFSVLLISNTGQNSRQFHVTPSVLRLFVIFMLLLCAGFGFLVYQYVSGDFAGSVHVSRQEEKNADEGQDSTFVTVPSPAAMIFPSSLVSMHT